MPKKKEEIADGQSAEYETTPKKAKIKKYKKKKQKQPGNEEQMDLQAEMEESLESSSITNTPSGKTTPKANKKKKNNPQQDDTSSEEERWLEAIESGKLEEVDDELKKIKPKDPKLMTARQRAMYEKNIGDPTSPTSKSRKSLQSTTMIDGVQANVSSTGQLLLALPNFKTKKEKEKLPLTAEDIEKSKEKAQKRKMLADEKREKDKKKTMERLLKKQDSKTLKSTKIRPAKQYVPVISYKNTKEGIFLSYPPNYPFPLEPKSAIDPPKKIFCGITGCKNLKRYNCSKTNIPLCSFECYKKNVESVKQMIF